MSWPARRCTSTTLTCGWPRSAACVCGLIVGILNGLITAYGNISAFIVTLGMMPGLAYGTGSILANSQNVFGFSPGFEIFGTGELLGSKTTDGIPYAILIMAAVAIVVFLAMSDRVGPQDLRDGRKQ